MLVFSSLIHKWDNVDNSLKIYLKYIGSCLDLFPDSFFFISCVIVCGFADE